jgi:2-polyprenyl-6-hydroxyphenyl methylase/3-demethylubiquinone-9 3-methyltransferase
MTKPAKNTICLWFDRDAEEAARFSTKTFLDSTSARCTGRREIIQALKRGRSRVHRDGHSLPRPQPAAPCSETDRFWNAIVGNGGQESACGWCKDKWGVSCQITPVVLTRSFAPYSLFVDLPDVPFS